MNRRLVSACVSAIVALSAGAASSKEVMTGGLPVSVANAMMVSQAAAEMFNQTQQASAAAGSPGRAAALNRCEATDARAPLGPPAEPRIPAQADPRCQSR